jgi:hypothetical protein
MLGHGTELGTPKAERLVPSGIAMPSSHRCLHGEHHIVPGN